MSLGTLLAGGASGYYHFVRFNSRAAPFAAIPEKFDLSSLPNKTVSFFISESGPIQLAANDTQAGVISQIRAAARVWNDVTSSDLRISFGGIFSPGTPQTTAGIEVTFDDLPPGLVGIGGPAVRADASSGPNGAFIPITRSVVVLPRNLSERPSFGERFFLSAVHEFGHTIGLQHSMTSSAMSTEVTRATSKSKPLTVDDVAGISLLYPAAGFLEHHGSISGRVTLAGQSVNLASVVAISPNGRAIGAMANPDGTYRIEGVPAGQYYVYAHPLPPAVLGESTPNNIVFPLDSDQRPIPASGAFETVFYPSGRAPQQTITVSAGSVQENINFSVNSRGSVQIFGVETYSFPGQVDVKPAFLSFAGSRSFIVVRGQGLTSGGGPAPGLTVSVIGGSAVPQGSPRVYVPEAPDFVRLDFQLNSFAGEGSRHLIFSRGDEVYVLPSGLTVTQRQPPSIASINNSLDARGARIAVISGANLSAETRILFDGAEAPVRSVEDGRLTVTPPNAPAGHRANVVALNPDGQSSLFLQGNSPASFTYDPVEPAALALSSSALPAGVEAMVEINGFGTNFAEGQTRIGFGTADVTAKRIWVVSPTKLLANVFIAPTAPLIATTVSVATGLQVLTQPFGFQVQASNPRLPVVNPQVVHASTGRGPQAGAPAVLTATNLASGPVTVTLNDAPVTVLSTLGGQITFQVPAGMNPGPAVLRLQSGGESALPVVISIDPPAPVIARVLTSAGLAIDATRPARPGDLLTLVATSLGDTGAAIAASRVQILSGNLEHQVLQVTPSATSNGHQVLFLLSPATPTSGSVNLTVSIDGRSSSAFALPVRGL